MRRLSGMHNGVEYVLIEYDTGMIECPADLLPALQEYTGTLPKPGVALEHACRALFGATLVVRTEVA